MMPKLPTIAMSPMPEFGYEPIPLILNGEKTHTLRKWRSLGRKEITVKDKRTGIIIEFHDWIQMSREEFLTDDFAIADGFVHTIVRSAADNLCALLKRFYKEVPETMWCNHFRLLEVPEDNDNA